jgi:hypothetical protein
MTTQAVTKVGLVAHLSDKGDWAFDLAYKTAVFHGLQLNIFSFLETPYGNSLQRASPRAAAPDIETMDLIARDRELREYYDEPLGDYVDVGFRVCVSARHEMELHRCLMHREYQLLILPYPDHHSTFTSLPIEAFAYQFIAPTILVGPDRHDQYVANPPAMMVVEFLGLREVMPAARWREIRRADVST